MMIKDQIESAIKEAIVDLGLGDIEVKPEHPADPFHGDYSTNVAMKLFGKLKDGIPSLTAKTPFELAILIAEKVQEKNLSFIEKTGAAEPGFVNLWLSKDYLVTSLDRVIDEKDKFGYGRVLEDKKIMVEYAHPNTHKEMHIGHMRTLITGEALARILAVSGAVVFRANYQGDIGPHVAKAVYGTRAILGERGMSFEGEEKLSNKEKAHLLGEGYVRGNSDYEAKKEEIDILNNLLYKKDPLVWSDYERTRKWSLDYYDELYRRFYTKFDRLFFESEVFEEGKRMVLANVPRVFEKSEGAIVFPGERYGLHRRVFVTADGNATYEGKDMGLAYKQFEAFPFDQNIHVVANEQKGYFEVMIKALETLDKNFVGREYHLPMGMVNLVGVKMSSRTGQIITVDELLDRVKSLVLLLIKKEGLALEEISDIAEKVAIGAVKYSVLKTDPTMNALFDFERSVSLDGDSGPYLQYTYARAQSVLRKAGEVGLSSPMPARGGAKSPSGGAVSSRLSGSNDINSEEIALLRTLYRFPEVVSEAGSNLKPNLICNYLFDLGQKFNTFYDKHSILGDANRVILSEMKDPKRFGGNVGDSSPSAQNDKQGAIKGFRVTLTVAVGQVIKNGLFLLGIEAPLKM